MYMFLAKQKALISFAVTTLLICPFVFAYYYAKNRFSNDAAHFLTPTNFDQLYC